MEKKIFSKGGPLSTGFHDVIYIVLLLFHLSYLFATSPFSFINGFNKASVTFISQVWCPKRGNRNMHKNKHEVRAKNSWIPLPCNVCNSAFGIYIYGDLDTSCPKKNIIILVISVEICLSCISYQNKYQTLYHSFNKWLKITFQIYHFYPSLKIKNKHFQH